MKAQHATNVKTRISFSSKFRFALSILLYDRIGWERIISVGIKEQTAEKQVTPVWDACHFWI